MAYDRIKTIKNVMWNGFFSEYLPPSFKLDETKLNLFKRIPPEKCDIIEPAIYNMSRFNDSNERRNIHIPEICSYVVLMNYVRSEKIVDEMINFTSNSSNSFSPILDDDGEILLHEQSYDGGSEGNVGNSSNYIENISKKLIRSKGAKGILNIDISNCFGSFYTHMLPAIKMGKEAAENDYKKTLVNDNSTSTVYKTYAKLDTVLRRTNGNRTNGILTGPLISKIIMEGMLVRIDKELETQNITFSRYVDDYEIYIYDENEIDQIKYTVNSILSRYYLSLNDEKTKYVSFPYYVVNNLEKIANSYLKHDLSTETLMELFNRFYVFEDEGTKGAIRFLLKNIEKSAKTPQGELYTSYLLTILNNDNRSLVKTCSLLISRHKEVKLTKDDKDTIVRTLEIEISKHHDLEVVWLLYLLSMVELNDLDSNVISNIISSNNDLAKIVLMNEFSSLFVSNEYERIKKSAHSWILFYELYKANELSEAEFIAKLGIVKNKSYYKWLKNKDFSFYVK